MEVRRFKRIGWFAGLILIFSARQITTETLTLTTYYPAPYGVYQQLISFGFRLQPTAEAALCTSGSVHYDNTGRGFRGCDNGVWGSLGGGVPQQMWTYSTPGTYTVSVTGGPRTVLVDVWGAGGGGAYIGSGGGGGGYGQRLIDNVSSCSIVVGAGGVGQMFAPGLDGGDSYVTCGGMTPITVTATGGKGGVLSGFGVAAGGTSTGQNWRVDGQNGSSNGWGGNGGKGGSGGPNDGAANGTAGISPGGGGSSGSNRGASGANGLVVIHGL
ncbi:MAG: hypothetical protein HY399_00605 [Elusimicrobia bacterium]|nr:hypothetical protein [Elusimicrobiota bacterium]